MASLRSEIRLLLTGPENRFFVAYKPPGWFLRTPFDGQRGGGVVGPVLAARLGVAPDCISFPSKLSVQESGLVVGCTDAAMHRTLANIIESGLCAKSYQCVVHANRRGACASVSRSAFRHAFGCFNHRKEVSSGVVNFELALHNKATALKVLPTLPDERLRSGLSQFVAQARVVSAHNVAVSPGNCANGDGFLDVDSRSRNVSCTDSTPGHTEASVLRTNVVTGGTPGTWKSENSTGTCRPVPVEAERRGKRTFAYIMENLSCYLKRFEGVAAGAETGTRTDHNLKPRISALARFRHMEIVCSDRDVNRHLVEVLSSLGLVVLTGQPKAKAAKIRGRSTACLELCGLQFPHPIYKDRVVEARVHEADPVVPEEWVHHALTSSGAGP
ncbi:pseudouridine synthase, putative [Babesia caballi]|uniref:Pseudouridine synthase, putative n=1 Tax=Babesia caballi TaxID=5871 RepID=A0AAV4LUR3_BABCB|nr:pseudouridine synthase, putative [Babesia caballi]